MLHAPISLFWGADMLVGWRVIEGTEADKNVGAPISKVVGIGKIRPFHLLLNCPDFELG
jgi:hypothetical protein